MDGYISLSMDSEETSTDLLTSIFTYGSRTAPPEDGVYFVNARLIMATVDDETNIELYCIDVCLLALLCY